MLFQLKLKGITLVDYDQSLDVDVNVLSIGITLAGLQAEWELRMSGAANTLLRDGKYTMPTPPAILAGIKQLFTAIAPGLIANLKSLLPPPVEAPAPPIPIEEPTPPPVEEPTPPVPPEEPVNPAT